MLEPGPTRKLTSLCSIGVAIMLHGCMSGDGGEGQKGPECPEPDAGPSESPVSPDVDGQLVINEFMAKNRLTATDEVGFAGDWIEIYNPTDTDISLEGYGVTDDAAKPGMHTLSGDVSVPAGGYLVLWLDEAPDRGPHHLCLSLAEEGGFIGLARPDGSYIDSLNYGTQAVDFSAARRPDGSDAWHIEWHASPGSANRDGDGAPIVPQKPGDPPEEVPAAGDLTEHILDYDRIPEIGLIVEPDDAAALEAEPRVYVPGYLVYEGREYGPIGVRLKGQNSFLPFSQKPSFRLNINEYAEGARFFGLKDMTLNNMAEDFSMMHERLAYRVARDFGVPASRANHVWMTVNGETYGLYTQLESMKSPLIGRWFDDPDGPLYDAPDVDFTEELVDSYELQDGEEDRSLLYDLADALAIADADAAIEAAKTYVNLDQYLRFWAMTSVVAQFDSMPYSVPGDDYFVYADPGTGRLWFLPWGMDETFYSSAHDVTEIHSVLARRCSESPACFQAYADKVWELLASLEAMDWEAERARIAEQIAPLVAMDTRKPYADAKVAEYQQQMHWFVTERRIWLEGMLPPPSSP